ncbi:lysylphosphatidylglycerol synthase transmembrane domain-containing protein [Pulveribacter suum]|uniref:Lysylphosphatidylglycerol synthetase family protein n=1 Tax=Pulveribacter suum TaxID=2116657 RepID=A0A2P1NIR2_9BURK|nr:YbhN family protein [Pulveribacter suum]AVP56922.1 lysylphosphatidylglycerol synthetase family protein [Pulveribacter suum]
MRASLPSSTPKAGPATGRWRALLASPLWRWVGGGLMAAVALLIVWLLVRQGMRVDWPAVWQSLKDLPPATLALSALLAWASHLAYGCFDLFGRHAVRHGLSVPRTMAVTLIAYPFTLNLGSLIGGVSVRYRLYSRQGLSVGQIAQVVVISIVTNWVGYFLLACVVFWNWAPQLPEGWHLSGQQLRWLGVLLAAVSALYLLLCLWRGGRPLTVRGRSLPLPTWRMALAQLLLSSLNWSLMGAAVWALAQGRAPYAAALATVLLGAVAGLLSRIPAGLGVLEAVGTAVLSAYLPVSQALAVVLAFRALYYLAPLLPAALALLATELLWRRRAPAADTSQNGF